MVIFIAISAIRKSLARVLAEFGPPRPTIMSSSSWWASARIPQAWYIEDAPVRASISRSGCRWERRSIIQRSHTNLVAHLSCPQMALRSTVPGTSTVALCCTAEIHPKSSLSPAFQLTENHQQCLFPTPPCAPTKWSQDRAAASPTQAAGRLLAYADRWLANLSPVLRRDLLSTP